MKKIFQKIMNLFVKQVNVKSRVSSRYDPVTDHIDSKTGFITKSAIVYNKMNERFLKLEDKACAIVIHPEGKVEVIFTKLYDAKDQKITLEEETLMSIAVFLRQPGFAEMLRNEFHNIAMNNISVLTEPEK